MWFHPMQQRTLSYTTAIIVTSTSCRARTRNLFQLRGWLSTATWPFRTSSATRAPAASRSNAQLRVDPNIIRTGNIVNTFWLRWDQVHWNASVTIGRIWPWLVEFRIGQLLKARADYTQRSAFDAVDFIDTEIVNFHISLQKHNRLLQVWTNL